MSSQASAKGRKVVLPATAAVDAASKSGEGGYNPRRMRRIIVEDPEWNRIPVPSLVELCLNMVVAEFANKPSLDAIPQKHRRHVLDSLPVDLPLPLMISHIDDEGFWKRAALARFKSCKPKNHGNSYKRLYLERHLTELIESFVPGESSLEELKQDAVLVQGYVFSLDVEQLLPPPSAEPDIVDEPEPEPETGAAIDLDGADADEEDDDDSKQSDLAVEDHLDVGTLVESLPKLEELSVCYKVKDCGMKFRWNMFGMTSGDAQVMAECIKYSRNLKSLTLHQSLLDDRKLRLITAKTLDNDCLTHLNLSHNVIGDKGARALAKLLNGHCVLEELDLCDNKICSVGARALGMSLQNNTTLHTLNLRLNSIADQGGNALFICLLRNRTLKRLNVSSNRITNLVTPALSEMLEKNRCLAHLDLTCNELGDESGKRVLDALDRNSSLLSMDMRLTGFAKDTELAINDVLAENFKRATAVGAR